MRDARNADLPNVTALVDSLNHKEPLLADLNQYIAAKRDPVSEVPSFYYMSFPHLASISIVNLSSISILPFCIIFAIRRL